MTEAQAQLDRIVELGVEEIGGSEERGGRWEENADHAGVEVVRWEKCVRLGENGCGWEFEYGFGEEG